ncbi:polysaccharide biosynthesis tyrosine autokinase [Novosphingobium sp. TH158]|uniref:GumC family protein n=1 Tax=Novosphingobium sp. TH158 TaxID=2067455 RepID=UPI0020B1603C|nr:polysaccharide biosynthesis tyrosine autokinase [Novosphingobium sp. TH158]
MATSAPINEPVWQPHYVADPADEIAQVSAARPAIDFRYIVAAIRSNLLLIVAIVSTALAIAVVMTMLETPRYTARTTIQINASTSKVLGREQGEEEQAPDYDVDRALKTQIEVLKSRGLAQRVVQKLNLGSNPEFFASQEVEGIAPGTPAKALAEAAAGLVQGNLAVTLPRDSRVVTISWESTNPRMSALIANTYASEFIQADLQRKFDSSTYARSFISDQLAQTKARLEQSELALTAYSRGAGLIRTRDALVGGKEGEGNSGGSVTTGSLLQINTAANEATARRIEAEGRWKAVSAAPLLSSQAVLTNSNVTSLLTEKAKVEAELQQEKARHLDEYPTVKAKQQQLAVLNQQIQQAATNVRNGILAEYRAAVETERRLSEQVVQLKSATLSEQDRTVQYALLAREADTNREVYDGLLQRFKQLNASAGIALSNISIVDTAQIPGGPSSPNLFKNLMAALLLGLGLAAVIVFFKDQFDDSIRVPEDVESKLGMALLGVVPRSHSDEPTEALLDPKSPISEAYNSLRGSLLYSTAEGLPHVMLITSAQPSEGKTTSAVAIASSFARMGRSVLLIDADMRRPSLHRRIGYENERGLSSLLTSHDAIGTAILPSGQDNLSFLPSGPIPPSPTELVSTARMEDILQQAAAAHQVVIIDSPPILGLADSPTLSALADGVVFIVEADRSRRGSLKMALRRLRAMRPVLLGAVLTKFDPLKAGNQYSEYYGYDYYQYGNTQES